MEQRTAWKINMSSASLQICNTVYQRRLPVLILSQINKVHASLPISSTFILLLSSHLPLGLPSVLFSCRSPHQNLVWNSPVLHTCHILRPSHISCLYHPNDIVLAVHISSSPSYSHSHSSLTSDLFQVSYSATYSHCHRPRFTLIQKTTSLIAFGCNYSLHFRVAWLKF